MQSWFGSFLSYLYLVFSNWLGIIGGVLTLYEVFTRLLPEKYKNKLQLLSKVIRPLAIGAILLSQFLVYHDLEVKSSNEIAKLSTARAEVPLLKIYYEDTELNQKTIPLRTDAEGRFRLSEFQLKNLGGKSTERVSVRLYFAGAIDSLGWERSLSPDKDFRSAFFWDGPPRISPLETWITEAFDGKIVGDLPREIRSKVQVFYGQERPAEAIFTIQLSK